MGMNTVMLMMNLMPMRLVSLTYPKACKSPVGISLFPEVLRSRLVRSWLFCGSGMMKRRQNEQHNG